MSAPTLAQLVDVLVDARGCGCCGFTSAAAEALLPDSCPSDEDGWVDHTYGDDCVKDFRALAHRALLKAREIP